jgi:ABC-2 type transport system permease protein
VKLARDTWLVFQRQILLLVRVPVGIAFNLAQPVTYVLLFAPVLKLALKSEGVTSYAQAYRVYVPGLLAVMALFGGLYGGFGLLAEIRSGIVERAWVTPVSRLAMMLGRALRDVANLLVSAVIITLFAMIFGLRVGVWNVLLAMPLLAILSLGSIALGYSLCMWARSEGALSTVINTISMPLALLAGTLVPLSLAPLWLLDVARWNPFYWVTSGVRALYTGQFGAAVVWQGLIVAAVLAVLTTTWSVRMFARAVR